MLQGPEQVASSGHGKQQDRCAPGAGSPPKAEEQENANSNNALLQIVSTSKSLVCLAARQCQEPGAAAHVLRPARVGLSLGENFFNGCANGSREVEAIYLTPVPRTPLLAVNRDWVEQNAFLTSHMDN
ncbi:hypothetical protein NM208_g12568 [Fusarium decemcellulare]|uniref:Uncharacterized protein n=1 Tax=Fusarium decemcellulare TaxID=57161 RepID=A0ACC1RRN5_9HYPO|nr:hypothetical protein NM208_g12568 [Fusarium decemcellulare]